MYRPNPDSTAIYTYIRVLDVGPAKQILPAAIMFKLWNQHQSELLLRALSQYPLANGAVELGLSPFVDATIHNARSREANTASFPSTSAATGYSVGI